MPDEATLRRGRQLVATALDLVDKVEDYGPMPFPEVVRRLQGDRARLYEAMPTDPEEAKDVLAVVAIACAGLASAMGREMELQGITVTPEEVIERVLSAS